MTKNDGIALEVVKIMAHGLIVLFAWINVSAAIYTIAILVGGAQAILTFCSIGILLFYAWSLRGGRNGYTNR